MTSKIYKSAQGKSIDLGTIMLQNEHVRAVGNMNVNARGDLLDSSNKVIESKSRQIQRQNNQITVPAPTVVHTSTRAAKRAKEMQVTDVAPVSDTVDTSMLDVEELPTQPAMVSAPAPVEDTPTSGGGLAAAIARSKVIKQEKEKTAKEIQRSTPGIRKI